MRNVARVSWIAAICLLVFLPCGLSVAETGSNLPAPVAGGVGGTESVAAKPASAVFVNRWPSFTVSYPADWRETTPLTPGCVFKAAAPGGSPSSRVCLFPTTNFSLENAAGVYLQQLANYEKDVKLLYDRETVLAGTAAREAEFEWTDRATGKRLAGLVVTTQKEGIWIVTSVAGVKSAFGDDLRKVPQSLEFTPKAKAQAPPYEYRTPKETDDGWKTAEASGAGLDKKKLSDLAGKILDETYPGIHSLLVVKNGKLVFEEYFPGLDFAGRPKAYTRDDLHVAMSVTKSFTSTLIGIAIDNSMIKGTDENLLAFFPEYKNALATDGKGAIRLQDMLSMTAGFDWNETTLEYSNPANPIVRMFRADDIIGYLLDRPLKDTPGRTFAYNTGLSTLLGVILERRSGLRFNEFAQKYLFGPLGIAKYELPYLDKAGKIPASGSGLGLRPRDMAKLGYLFLRKGEWEGKRIVSAKWVEEASRQRIKFPVPGGFIGYGYQWWLTRFEIDGRTIEGYAALGYGGQGIYVFPGLDAVIVLTAGNYAQSTTVSIPVTMMNSYILPAVRPE